ncbi:MAG: sulfide/dihydroorotate dehydrogenase-like FAD/NAD-binding protein [Methanothrix sp.]|nr:sulfide/dihydroorotate dehydrogenase-like FAD/NAD-binding protein [Methanothrix sp.]
MYRILSRREMAGGSIVLNEVEAPGIAKKAQPGQFVIMRANETGERIPLTMADFDPDRGTITVIYSVAGRTTALFSDLQEGDCYQNVTGPLGRPTDLGDVGAAICIGGGTGVAVLYPIAKRLKQRGERVISIIGARTERLLILKEEMAAISDELLICTDDGSLGRGALVTELLSDLLERERPGAVVAIGPVPMMKRVSEITRPYGIRTTVSLNPIMIDGTGMCGSCRVEVDGMVRFACVDGPEFDGHKVDFDLLMQRLQTYGEEERRSLEAHGGALVHRCKMEEEAQVRDLGGEEMAEVRAA